MDQDHLLLSIGETAMTDSNPILDEHLEITGPPKRLDHLPVVVSCLQRLGLARIIDERVPSHPQRDLSTGTCIEALILAILSGTHTLYRVGQTLAPYDLSTTFGRPMTQDKLSDNRLSRALDAIFKVGLSEINTSVILKLIEIFDLDVSLACFDTTGVSLHGKYETSAPGDTEDPNSIPHVTYGYSKDHRPDLKQVLV